VGSKENQYYCKKQRFKWLKQKLESLSNLSARCARAAITPPFDIGKNPKER
jgi:hypothetical protein